jgi:hypothetical protein
MLEIIAVFLIIFGVISMLTAYSGMSLLFTLVVMALLMLLGGAIRKDSRQ